MLHYTRSMFPKRKLLYHRGLDDSVGTYATNYVYVVECFILIGLLLYQFVKNRGVSQAKSGLSKSTVAVIIFLAASGVAALVGGLAHQYLQTVCCCYFGGYLENNLLIRKRQSRVE